MSSIFGLNLRDKEKFDINVQNTEFESFYTKHCSNWGAVSLEKARALVKEGLEYFRDGLPENLPTNETKAKHLLTCIAWAVHYNAACQGKAYTNGTVVLRSEVVESLMQNHPGMSLEGYFNGYLHERPSSHYAKRSIQQYGVDIDRDGVDALPVDKRTILIGKLDTPEVGENNELEGNKEKSSYFLKFESYGFHWSLHPKKLLHSILHAFDYVCKKSGLAAAFNKAYFYFRPDMRIEPRREKIPGKILTLFKKISAAMPHSTQAHNEVMRKAHLYGVSYINHYCKRAGLEEALSLPAIHKRGANLQDLRELRQEISKLGGDLDIRKGSEYIMSSPTSGATSPFEIL